MNYKWKAIKNCLICDGTGSYMNAMDFNTRCDCYKQTKAWKKHKRKEPKLKTNKELLEYCNALFVLIRDHLPICPSKNKIMWENAIKEGNKIAENRLNEILYELARDIAKLPCYDIEYAKKIDNFIRTWRPDEKSSD